MRTIKRSAMAAMAMLALVLGAPGAASAAGAEASEASPASAAFTRNCPTGMVVSIANNLPVRAGIKISSSIFYTGQKGYLFQCTEKVYAIGDRYTACGVTDANGWINVYVPEADRWGYTYMTCLEDVYL